MVGGGALLPTNIQQNGVRPLTLLPLLVDVHIHILLVNILNMGLPRRTAPVVPANRLVYERNVWLGRGRGL